MEITLNKHRWNTIYNWKRRGLVYHDYDELYQTYINTMECEHCLTEFKSTKDRHLDHCHITGQFRKIVCHKCNVNDTYIKYPNGYTDEDRKERDIKFSKEYRQKNLERIHKRDNEKHNCDCGGKYTHCHKLRHMKSKKHQSYLDNNNHQTT